MKSPYMNPDGTFKGGFDGCVLHMTKMEGHSEESARKICGSIAQQKMRNRSGAAVLAADFKHPADGWYQIEVPGEHSSPQGPSKNGEQPVKVIQVIDSAAVTSVVNRFNAEADEYERTTGQPFPGMVIDVEHFKHDPTKESRAYGWLMRLENREGKPFGQVRWTATGKAAVDGGDYRFFSTEYDPPDIQVLNSKGRTIRLRPLRLSGLSLTNMPNNKGGAPITNRDADQLPHKHQPTKQMTKLAAYLGLSAEASEDAILTEITKIKNRTTEAEGKVVPLQTRVTDLETANKDLLAAQIESDLAPLRNRLTEEEIKPLREGLLTNRKATLPFVTTLITKLSKAGGTERAAGSPGLTNRQTAKTPGQAETAGGSSAATPQALRTEVRKICNRDGLSGPSAFEIGFNRLREERPDLFEPAANGN